jgi:HlyD family secretion protein
VRTTVIILVVVAALAGGASGYFGHDPLRSLLEPTSRPATEPATTVVARGRLEPQTGLIAVGLPAGSRVERLCIKEGDGVREGQPLAYLDTHGELEAARNSARAQLDEARKRLEAEKAFGQANVEAARLHVRQTEEVQPLTIKAQEAEVCRSQAELEKATLDRQRSAQMLKDRAIPKSQDDAAALIERQAQEQLNRNLATLAQLRRDQEIKTPLARADLKSAEAGLQRAQFAVQVDSLKAALEVAEARLRRAVIRAPVAGQVLKVLTRAGEAAGQDPLLQMGDTGVMYAVAEVYETDVRRVHQGQRATVTSKAFGSDAGPLEGTVERIASLVHKNRVLGIDPAAEADARIVEVRVRLDDSLPACRYNQLQVDVTIDVGAEGPGGAGRTSTPPASGR